MIVKQISSFKAIIADNIRILPFFLKLTEGHNQFRNIIIYVGQLLCFPLAQKPYYQLNSGTPFQIQDKVILIPRNPADNRHKLYTSLSNELK